LSGGEAAGGGLTDLLRDGESGYEQSTKHQPTGEDGDALD
jgi:hypothetical protein